MLRLYSAKYTKTDLLILLSCLYAGEAEVESIARLRGHTAKCVADDLSALIEHVKKLLSCENTEQYSHPRFFG